MAALRSRALTGAFPMLSRCFLHRVQVFWSCLSFFFKLRTLAGVKSELATDSASELSVDIEETEKSEASRVPVAPCRPSIIL